MAAKKFVTPEQLVEFAVQADERLDALESKSIKGYEITISSGGWTNDSGDENYPYQYKLTVEGVSAASRADVVLDSNSVVVAMGFGLDSGCDTSENTVIMKSAEAPTADLTGTLYVHLTAMESV